MCRKFNYLFVLQIKILKNYLQKWDNLAKLKKLSIPFAQTTAQMAQNWKFMFWNLSENPSVYFSVWSIKLLEKFLYCSSAISITALVNQNFCPALQNSS